jgi:primosomal protein N' (replication factor Y)
LTYHKYKNHLHCHLCGYKTYLPHKCPGCGSDQLVLEGYGTQKIEDELDVLFPDARIERMDFDTTRRKQGHENLIEKFENQEVDILVGTQMVTKGLDFDHVGLVGVIHGDQQLFLPDFRATERTFQLMVQVSGRAGRKHLKGKVIIQTFHPDHAIFSDIKQANFDSFFQREAGERRRFHYPPYYRLIKLTIRHQKQDKARYAAHELSKWLKGKLGSRVIGPAEPHVARVRGKYLFDIGIKLEKNNARIHDAKLYITAMISRLKKIKGMSSVRVRIDVDP